MVQVKVGSSWPNRVDEDVPLGWQVETPPAKPLPSLLEARIASCRVVVDRRRLLIAVTSSHNVT